MKDLRGVMAMEVVEFREDGEGDEEVERKCQKREKGNVSNEVGLGLNEVGVGLMRVISEVMSCQ